MATTTLRAYLDDVQAMLGQQALEEVIGHCRHILQHFPKNLETYRLLGQALSEKRRFQEAMDVFQRVLAAVPNDFAAHVGMSECWEQQNNFGNAVWHMERAFEQDPNNHALQEELKRLYERNRQTPPARMQLSRVALARVYFNGKLYEQAISELQAALPQHPGRLDLQVLYADALWQAEHIAESTEAALLVLESLPDSRDANRIMAALWLRANRPSDAKPYFLKVEQLDPFLAWTLVNPDGKEVPKDAFKLPRLQWDVRAAAALASNTPEWMATIGDAFDNPETVDLTMQDRRKVWMDDFAPSSSPQPTQRTGGLLDKYQPAFGAPAAAPSTTDDDVPSWFKEFEVDSQKVSSSGAIPIWTQEDNSFSAPEFTLPPSRPDLPAAPTSPEPNINDPLDGDWLFEGTDFAAAMPVEETPVSDTSPEISASVADALEWLQTGGLTPPEGMHTEPNSDQTQEPIAESSDPQNAVLASAPIELDWLLADDDAGVVENAATTVDATPSHGDEPMNAMDALEWLQTNASSPEMNSNDGIDAIIAAGSSAEISVPPAHSSDITDVSDALAWLQTGSFSADQLNTEAPAPGNDLIESQQLDAEEDLLSAESPNLDWLLQDDGGVNTTETAFEPVLGTSDADDSSMPSWMMRAGTGELAANEQEQTTIDSETSSNRPKTGQLDWLESIDATTISNPELHLPAETSTDVTDSSTSGVTSLLKRLTSTSGAMAVPPASEVQEQEASAEPDNSLAPNMPVDLAGDTPAEEFMAWLNANPEPTENAVQPAVQEEDWLSSLQITDSVVLTPPAQTEGTGSEVQSQASDEAAPTDPESREWLISSALTEGDEFALLFDQPTSSPGTAVPSDLAAPAQFDAMLVDDVVPEIEASDPLAWAKDLGINIADQSAVETDVDAAFDGLDIPLAQQTEDPLAWMKQAGLGMPEDQAATESSDDPLAWMTQSGIADSGEHQPEIGLDMLLNDSSNVASISDIAAPIIEDVSSEEDVSTVPSLADTAEPDWLLEMAPIPEPDEGLTSQTVVVPPPVSNDMPLMALPTTDDLDWLAAIGTPSDAVNDPASGLDAAEAPSSLNWLEESAVERLTEQGSGAFKLPEDSQVSDVPDSDNALAALVLPELSLDDLGLGFTDTPDLSVAPTAPNLPETLAAGSQLDKFDVELGLDATELPDWMSTLAPANVGKAPLPLDALDFGSIPPAAPEPPSPDLTGLLSDLGIENEPSIQSEASITSISHSGDELNLDIDLDAILASVGDVPGVLGVPAIPSIPTTPTTAEPNFDELFGGTTASTWDQEVSATAAETDSPAWLTDFAAENTASTPSADIPNDQVPGKRATAPLEALDFAGLPTAQPDSLMLNLADLFDADVADLRNSPPTSPASTPDIPPVEPIVDSLDNPADWLSSFMGDTPEMIAEPDTLESDAVGDGDAALMDLDDGTPLQGIIPDWMAAFSSSTDVLGEASTVKPEAADSLESGTRTLDAAEIDNAIAASDLNSTLDVDDFTAFLTSSSSTIDTTSADWLSQAESTGLETDSTAPDDIDSAITGLDVDVDAMLASIGEVAPTANEEQFPAASSAEGFGEQLDVASSDLSSPVPAPTEPPASGPKRQSQENPAWLDDMIAGLGIGESAGQSPNSEVESKSEQLSDASTVATSDDSVDTSEEKKPATGSFGFVKPPAWTRTGKTDALPASSAQPSPSEAEEQTTEESKNETKSDVLDDDFSNMLKGLLGDNDTDLPDWLRQ
ncbi:MAG: tetratricopeptide repeat protein [Anaerolineae bacterium]|nr:tetratricopeptide repeat protein [Anaerolineae bacterium]